MYDPSRPKILIIAATPASHIPIHAVLESAGYPSLLAESLEEVGEALRRHRVALAFCEHQPPTLDGVALLGALGRVRPEILRVLYTPDQGPHVFERATREAEVHYFLHLPFIPGHLLELTRALLRRAHAPRAATRKVLPGSLTVATGLR